MSFICGYEQPLLKNLCGIIVYVESQKELSINGKENESKK